MTRTILAASAIVSLAGCGAHRASYQVTQSYDEFDDYTTVDVGPFDLEDEGWTNTLRMKAWLLFSGKWEPGKQPRGAALMFIGGSATWRFLRSRDLVMLVDGERLRLGTSDHDGTAHGGSVSEYLHYTVDPATFIRIVNAKSVRLQIGLVESHLDPRAANALRSLARYIPGADVAVDAEVQGRRIAPGPQ